MEKYLCNSGLFPKSIVFNGIEIATGLVLDGMQVDIYCRERNQKLSMLYL
ncbi:MAG: hypothetical protein AAF757_18220 [Cyanobacteria bacterium P01_D01_bin.116]